MFRIVSLVNHYVSNSMNVLKRVSAICLFFVALFPPPVAAAVTVRRQQVSPSLFKPANCDLIDPLPGA